jgi:hypothetical protein
VTIERSVLTAEAVWRRYDADESRLTAPVVGVKLSEALEGTTRIVRAYTR